MAGEFFVDTSAWFPLVVQKHPDHQGVAAALRAQLSRRHRLVTTNLVVAESHALLLRRAGYAAALTFARTVGQSPNLVVHSDPDLEARAVGEWLERYDDQAFSLADAVSFAVMTARGIRDAVSLDHHFEVAGFRRIPSRT